LEKAGKDAELAYCVPTSTRSAAMPFSRKRFINATAGRLQLAVPDRVSGDPARRSAKLPAAFGLGCRLGDENARGYSVS
jgi:hypothetical protein